MKSFYPIALPAYSDQRGTLIPIEFSDSIPFSVARVYFLTNTPALTTRGAHCHFQEEEVFVCIRGQCTARIDTNGTGKQEVLLNDPTKAIFVGKKVWHEFDSFSPDALLLAFSSTPYFPGEENYEYSYETFCSEIWK